jgi:hypothetical protein
VAYAVSNSADKICWTTLTLNKYYIYISHIFFPILWNFVPIFHGMDLNI